MCRTLLVLSVLFVITTSFAVAEEMPVPVPVVPVPVPTASATPVTVTVTAANDTVIVVHSNRYYSAEIGGIDITDHYGRRFQTPSTKFAGAGIDAVGARRDANAMLYAQTKAYNETLDFIGSPTHSIITPVYAAPPAPPPVVVAPHPAIVPHFVPYPPPYTPVYVPVPGYYVH